jgi:hypothetical protein
MTRRVEDCREISWRLWGKPGHDARPHNAPGARDDEVGPHGRGIALRQRHGFGQGFNLDATEAGLAMQSRRTEGEFAFAV